jgi:outer membrane protein TolC
MSEDEMQSAEALLAKNIAQAYYNTALQRKQVAFDRQNLNNYDSLYQIAQVRYEEGLIEQIDVNRVKSTFLAVQDAFQRSQTQYENSVLQLKFWMGMPLQENLQIEDLHLSSPLYQSEASFDLQHHPEYEIYQQRRLLATSQMQQSKLNFLPTVSLYASYSRQSFSNSFALFDSSVDWFGIGLVGGKITLPLFQRTHNFRNVNLARLAVEKAENAFQQFQLDQQTKYLEQENNLTQHIESIQLKEENLQLAEENQEIATYKFSQGAYSSIDLKDVQQETLDAQRQYLQAYADYYTTLAELNYLIGKY